MMTQNIDFTSDIVDDIRDMHRFAHKAMATVYEIL
jgi:hypothetical protein